MNPEKQPIEQEERTGDQENKSQARDPDRLNEIMLATAYIFLNQSAIDPANTPETVQIDKYPDQWVKASGDIRQAVLNFMVSRSIQQLSEMFEDVPQWIAELIQMGNQAGLAFLNVFQDGMEDLLPFIQEEIDEYQKTNPGAISFYDFMKGAGEEGNSADPDMFHNVLARARERQEITQVGERLMRDLPYLQSTLPKRHTAPINALANALQKNLVNAGPRDVVVQKGNPEITIYTVVTLSETGDLEISGNYTQYDRQVQNAVGSLYLYGHDSHICTPATVYRAMTNGTDTAAPSAQQIEAVTRSLEKLRNIHVYANIADEAQYRKYKDSNGNPVSFIIDDKILSLRALTVTAGGRQMPAYKIQDEPILFTYSRLSGQLITVDSYLLDIKEVGKDGLPTEVSIANTESRIAIKGYLLMRIEVMKNDRKKAAEKLRRHEFARSKDETKPQKTLRQFSKQTNRIRFDRLFEETDITTKNRVAQQRYRDYAFQVLNYWKAVGYIKGYTTARGEKNSFHAIDIEI